MMQPEPVQAPVRLYTILLLIFWSCLAHAEIAGKNDCRPAQPQAQEEMSLDYSSAVLWKISRDGLKPSYIFGTIHVSDPAITTLPPVVREKLDSTSVFVMEALPDSEEVERFSNRMFFNDGTTLRDFLDDDLLKLTNSIMGHYNYSPEAVILMKPWAAFLIMNYPAEEGIPLDLKLLKIARNNGAKLHGLETLTEQAEIFSNFNLKTQVRFLLDTICNYDILNNDFEIMKSLYLKRDLNALYSYNDKYTFSQEKIYKDLVTKILTDRNRIMVDRLRSILAKGGAFIAIGALHLPGNDGVLSLLADRGYRIAAVY